MSAVGIRSWLRGFGLDAKRRLPQSVSEPGRRAIEVVHEIIDRIDDLLLEFAGSERMELIDELYYGLGAVMCGLAHERMLLEGVREKRGAPAFYEEMRRELGNGLGILDHGRYYGGEEVVYHPYDGTMEEFEKLISICRKLGLTFTVNGASEYFPGHSFRIVIRKRNT